MDKQRAAVTQSLVTKCLAHLQREEQLLISLQGVVDDMRRSLVAREDFDTEELTTSSLTDDLKEVTKDRGRLQAELSEFFDVPKEAATLSLLVEHAGERAGKALREMQFRLSGAAEGLNRTLAATGNLARHLHELIECVFRSLGGDATSSVVYERSGRHRV